MMTVAYITARPMTQWGHRDRHCHSDLTALAFDRKMPSPELAEALTGVRRQPTTRRLIHYVPLRVRDAHSRWFGRQQRDLVASTGARTASTCPTPHTSTWS